MSIFKSSGIVLKIDKGKEKDFIYTIFSKDYGKIKANQKLIKKEKTLDLGYIINFEIETKEARDIHKIRNIKIKSEFLSQKRNFSEINNYLKLLNSILKKIPDLLPVLEIYDIVENLTNFTSPSLGRIATNMEIQLILANLKILAIVGDLDINHENQIIQKILSFINNSKIDNILKLSGITNELKKELEKLIF